MEPLKVRGWSIEPDTVAQGGIDIPVIRARIKFNKDMDTEAETMHDIWRNLVDLFASKGIAVRSGSSGFIEEDGEDIPMVLFTIEQSQFSQLQGPDEVFLLLLGS